MQQFLQKYAKPKEVDKNIEQKKKQMEEEQKRKAEEEKRKMDEELQKQRDELEKEQKEREMMVQKLIAEQKKQQEGPAVQAKPKARKQPFQSNKPTTPSLKRSQVPPRTKPAMPVAKRQRVSVILPKYKPRVIPKLEPPKPPPLAVKTVIDELANFVVEKGLQYEDEIRDSKDICNKYAFLSDPDCEEFKYYEYKKEILCEEKGIVLQRNVNESESVRALNETVKEVSQKYKKLEQELEEDDKMFKPQVGIEDYCGDEIPASVEKEHKFLKKLSSHLHKTTEQNDDSVNYSPLVAGGNKGAMLLKNMGWTEGWLGLATNIACHT